MRYVLGVVIAAILAALAIRVVQMYQARAAESGKKPNVMAVSVRVGTVDNGPVRDIGKFYGSLEARYRFLVAPKVSGRLIELAVNAGDKVEPGQLIARIDREELQLAVDEARAVLTVAKATLTQSKTSMEQAQREFDRQQRLLQDHVSTAQKFEEAESDLGIKKALHELNLAQINKQEAALKAAELRLGYSTIEANWDLKNGGAVRYVGERYADEGALLQVNDPICSILDTERLTAVLDVPERLFPRLVAGMPVKISVSAYPNEFFMGTLRVRPSELSVSSRQARVEVELPNPDQRLVPGMFAEAEVVFAELNDVPRLPVAALVRREEKQGIFVVERSTGAPTGEMVVETATTTTKPATRYEARFLQVTTGVREAEWIQIKAPAITAPVILLGQHRLIDHTPVELDAEARDLVDSLPPQTMALGEGAAAEPPV